jgi:hypothetical protein
MAATAGHRLTLEYQRRSVLKHFPHRVQC